MNEPFRQFSGRGERADEVFRIRLDVGGRGRVLEPIAVCSTPITLSWTSTDLFFRLIFRLSGWKLAEIRV
jgi:hypothetical protein